LCILGNHELALLDMKAANKYRIPPPLISTLEWGLGKLSDSDLEYLRSFDTSINFSFGNISTLLCYHGSPSSTTDIILAETPNQDVAKIIKNNKATVMAGGHTHIQMLRRWEGILLLNPGSVGAAFPNFFSLGEIPELIPWAEYTILSYHSEILNICMRRLPFDTQALKSAIKKSDLPIKEWWLEQYNK
jgi:hypothetical protein